MHVHIQGDITYKCWDCAEKITLIQYDNNPCMTPLQGGEVLKYLERSRFMDYWITTFSQISHIYYMG